MGKIDLKRSLFYIKVVRLPCSVTQAAPAVNTLRCQHLRRLGPWDYVFKARLGHIPRLSLKKKKKKSDRAGDKGTKNGSLISQCSHGAKKLVPVPKGSTPSSGLLEYRTCGVHKCKIDLKMNFFSKWDWGDGSEGQSACYAILRTRGREGKKGREEKK